MKYISIVFIMNKFILFCLTTIYLKMKIYGIWEYLFIIFPDTIIFTVKQFFSHTCFLYTIKPVATWLWSLLPAFQFEMLQGKLEAEVENLSWKIQKAEITDRGVRITGSCSWPWYCLLPRQKRSATSDLSRLLTLFLAFLQAIKINIKKRCTKIIYFNETLNGLVMVKVHWQYRLKQFARVSSLSNFPGSYCC